MRTLIFIPLAFAAACLSAFEKGTQLPRPDDHDLLVAARKFSLKPTHLSPDTKILIFFYSASWCAPCTTIGKELRNKYEALKELTPGIELITFSVDFSTRARADYLREKHYPWPALAPQAMEQDGWNVSLENGTPQFQAWAIDADTIQALMDPGSLDAALKRASMHLATP
ncbi:MAG: redoxin domain-containing protein [Opitutales bacterium]